MANEGKTDSRSSEVDDLAFRIFSQAAAARPVLAGERDAREAYRLAEVFLDVRRKVKSGEIAPEPTGPQLADCCCPNEPASHPINLVARLHTDRNGVQTPGDLAKVNRIRQWLDRNPTPEKEPSELIYRFNREFRELAWKLPEINMARAIFPAYVKN